MKSMPDFDIIMAIEQAESSVDSRFMFVAALRGRVLTRALCPLCHVLWALPACSASYITNNDLRVNVLLISLLNSYVVSLTAEKGWNIPI